jgi:hypothetical protein
MGSKHEVSNMSLIWYVANMLLCFQTSYLRFAFCTINSVLHSTYFANHHLNSEKPSNSSMYKNLWLIELILSLDQGLDITTFFLKHLSSACSLIFLSELFLEQTPNIIQMEIIF